MQFFSSTFPDIALRCVVVYVFIIVSIRLFGKKDIGQLSILDFVLILLISNAVQNAMVGSNNSLEAGLVAAMTLFLTNLVLRYVTQRSVKIERFLIGDPLLLVYKGDVNKTNLRRSRISIEELMGAVREHGLSDIRDVDLATLEVNGNISILSGSTVSDTMRESRVKHKTSRVKK